MTITPRSPSSFGVLLTIDAGGRLRHQQRADQIDLDDLAEDLAGQRRLPC